MIAWIEKRREFLVFFVVPMSLVVSLAVLVAFLPIISLWLHHLQPDWISESAKAIDKQIERLGTYGDMFGMLNAIFSGAAFCAIYYTLRVQQKQHDLQKEDIEMKKAKADLQVDRDKSKNSPKFRIGGEKEKHSSIKVENDDGLYNAQYARLTLINKSEEIPAINCRVLLTLIQKFGTNGKYFDMEEYQNTLRLLQFTEEDNAPEEHGVTIPCHCPSYFNVLSLKEITKDGDPERYIQVAHKFSKYNVTRNILKMNNKYILVLSVVSDNAIPFQVGMEISIGKTWDSLQVLNVLKL
jgi:hypothetical protein